MNNILIANRGEIAVRIIETAKKMGIKTFVIKTAKEPYALYLEKADEIIDRTENIEGVPEFLDIEGLLGIANEHNIEAIHPGYGFLAESPYFAERCEEENIIFIGPSPDAIYKMGNKTIAKQIATTNNVPLLKGSYGSVSSEKEAVEIAEKIGFPVILKAASGGGGRGMRIVESPENMKKMFRMATDEAQKAFNDPSVFIEKYVKNPRHVEFQILADTHGNMVHLGERECSIQRKHQKLIEEAPSTALNESLRNKMGQAALKVAKAVNYQNAGTVEFLLDDEGNFYFMEMNTRIQVEHPVTEEVTGIDLIEQQIRVARGEKLPFAQDDIKIKGWAIECRINAEDVQSNFSPYLGIIEKVKHPTGKNIRIDTGIQEGAEITPYYDSMISKLICYGEDRKSAISNSLSALRKIKIKGLKTTIPFCKAALSSKAFRNGTLNTSFIENELDPVFYQEPFEELLAAYFATYSFAKELKIEQDMVVDYNKGKELDPWVLNKRLKSI